MCRKHKKKQEKKHPKFPRILGRQYLKTTLRALFSIQG